MIGVHGSGLDGIYEIRLSPATSNLLVSIGAIRKKRSQFVHSALLESSEFQEPDEMSDQHASVVDGAFGVLVDVARQEPSDGQRLQFCGEYENIGNGVTMR